MSIHEHIKEFHGLPVFDISAADATADAALPAAAEVAWRIGLDYDSETGFEAAWQEFLTRVDTERVRAVVLGPWWAEDYESLTEPLAVITGSAERLPNLRALFVGDVTSEECELSWIQMADITPLLEAFGQLAELVVRGASDGYDGDGGLALRPVGHERLRALRFESGGLPAEVVRAVGASDFPALERLELWLGVQGYGGDATVADLAPILTGARLPALKHLGLEDSELQDEIAAAVASAPVVARLDSLSLAMGTLTDDGAAALLEGQPLTHLSRLDLHHHYLSEDVQQRLQAVLGAAGVDLDLTGRVTPRGDWRYVANAE